MTHRHLTKPEAEALALARGILYEFSNERPTPAELPEQARPGELVYYGMTRGRIVELAAHAEDAVFDFLNVLTSHTSDPVASEYAHTRITLPTPAEPETPDELTTRIAASLGQEKEWSVRHDG